MLFNLLELLSCIVYKKKVLLKSLNSAEVNSRLYKKKTKFIKQNSSNLQNYLQNQHSTAVMQQSSNMGTQISKIQIFRKSENWQGICVHFRHKSSPLTHKVTNFTHVPWDNKRVQI